MHQPVQDVPSSEARPEVMFGDHEALVETMPEAGSCGCSPRLGNQALAPSGLVIMEAPHLSLSAQSNGIRLLAIDAGASKTVAVLADANGAELARARGAGAHIGLLGAGVWDMVLPTAAAALAEVGAALVPEQLHCCLAIAGGEHVAALAAARAASPRFGRLQIVSDGLAALSGCLGATETGVMVAVGTVAWARSRQDETTKAGGHAFPAGDEGGGPGSACN
ncbi:hypothetical protein ACRAWG_01045 [Methylobacterium sp. P31]